MPSLYFYAAEDDHPLLLDTVFQPRLGFRVCETQSRLNEEIRQFVCAEDVLDEWRRSTGRAVALLSPGSRATPTLEKIHLRGASFRPGDDAVTAEARALIREIRKAAPVKARSRPVLPGAHRASQASLILDPGE